MIRTINVGQVIDGHRVGPLQLRTFVLCAAVLFIDGFDVQGISYVAPAISQAWALPRGAFGPTFSAGLFGVMLGALRLCRRYPGIPQPDWVLEPWSAADWGLIAVLILSSLATVLG